MYIPIEYLASRGIRQEDAAKFETSFFSDIYRQALVAIAHVIRTNRHYINNTNKVAQASKTEMDFFDVQNVVAFTGRRGTGKTSAMISVHNCLLNTDKISEDFCDDHTKNEIAQVDFWPLPRIIDASHLGEKEDLLEVVIAYMLKELIEVSEDPKFNEQFYGQDVEKLKKDLTKIQNDYDSLIQTNGSSIPVSYKTLVQGADKHHIQHIFQDVIARYLTIMMNCKRKDSENNRTKAKVLLICIDDIDMYPGDPMQIMQCLYRYFTLPNVLVLTSWNYKMLRLYIYKHYFKRTNTWTIDMDSDGGEGRKSDRERAINEQCDDYLRKIIPFDMRIVMPSWKKSDYKDVAGKMIRIYSQKDIAKLREDFPALYPGRLYNNLCYLASKNELDLEVKSFIFQLLADRTGIYLDANGYKQHFMEPDGLRSTFELFDSIYLMQNIRERPLEQSNINKYMIDGIDDKVRQNYKAILDTFYFKILPGLNLTDRESAFFDSLCKEKLSRRGKIIIDAYYVKKHERMNQDDSFLYDFPFYEEDNSFYRQNRDYSIGEVFRIIHHSTRENVFSKELIKAILASYSFVMPYYFDDGMFTFFSSLNADIVTNGATGQSQISKDKFYEIGMFKSDKIKTIFSIIGGSLLGNWAYDLFGKRRVRCRFSIDRLVNSGNRTLSSKSTNPFDSPYGKFISLLLFVRFDRHLENESLSFLQIKDGENESEYEFNVDFDPTAFLINTMRIEEFVSQIIKISRLDKKTDEQMDEQNPFCKTLRDVRDYIVAFLSRYDLSDQNLVTIDFTKYPLPPFPVHQIDLTYNVVKRAVKDIIYISDSELTVKSPDVAEDPSGYVVDTLKRFYNNLLKELCEEKKHYPLYENNADHTTNNIFDKRFWEVGESIGIWKVDSQNNDSNGTQKKVIQSDTVHNEQSVKIELTLQEYCSFSVEEISEEEEKANAPSKGNARINASLKGKENIKSLSDIISFILNDISSTDKFGCDNE